MSQADDINSIVKVKKIKTPLPTLPVQTGIKSKKGVGTSDKGSNAGLVSPVTFEVLTWDDSKDVPFQADSGPAVLKSALTGQIVDAVGTVILIDTFIEPPP